VSADADRYNPFKTPLPQLFQHAARYAPCRSELFSRLGVSEVFSGNKTAFCLAAVVRIVKRRTHRADDGALSAPSSCSECSAVQKPFFALMGSEPRATPAGKRTRKGNQVVAREPGLLASCFRYANSIPLM